jgi:hypothetical protein
MFVNRNDGAQVSAALVCGHETWSCTDCSKVKLRLLLSLVIDQEAESVFAEPDQEAALVLKINAKSSEPGQL